MRSFKLPLLALLVAAILIGIFWGLKIKSAGEKRRAPEADARVLKILAVRGALPAPILKAFSADANTKIELAEEASPDAVLNRLNSTTEHFDLVTLLSAQAPQAIATLKIQPFKLDTLKGFELVSTDFIDLPTGPTGSTSRPSVLPILWGITGFVSADKDVTTWKQFFEQKGEAKVFIKPSLSLLALLATPLESATTKPEADSVFLERARKIMSLTDFETEFFKSSSKSSADEERPRALHHGELSGAVPGESAEKAATVRIPDDGGLLWVMAIAVGAHADNSEGANAFAAYLLKPNVAIGLSTLSRQASTNTSVEAASKLPAELKPSYLRTIPMTRLRVLNESIQSRVKLLKTVKEI